ncbi:DUF6519 domain-containing protein [Accumulibacter sp.]|uniref:DUF6519 domain-containing protein n=1 Tax=Accumulibacter sp. TaxID=2053492 RepID=UPI00260B79C3|nr:DUF6519 domain-containing protein [Accumulibacter sp.]
MKTEISRDSLQPDKNYTGVYQQQGRMLTDADWNELVDILKGRLADALKDVIGNSAGSIGGTPRRRALGIIDDGAIKVRPGHVYVDGAAAKFRGETPQPYATQPDFPSPPPTAGDYRLYADVWERSVTQLGDARLRDVGLHGADTCTRQQMLVQIKWCPAAVDPEQSPHNPRRGDAPLSLTLTQKTTEPDACDPCAAELDIDSRVGNYLFRVEVHDVKGPADNPSEITLKWSSENGAEQFVAEASAALMPAGFIGTEWVYEFYDETSERHLGAQLASGPWQPSRLALQVFDESSGGYAVPAIPNSNPTDNPVLVRRWDGYCRIDLAANALLDGRDRGVDLSEVNDVDALGHVEIGTTLDMILNSMDFSLALAGRSFIAGDYWLAEVREAIHGEGSTLLVDAPPRGILHHYLTLGSVVGGVLQPNPELDRKYAFPTLSEMTRLFMAGGDGQEIVPGEALPQPLRVGVANGEWPVAGATVRFVIEAGGGTLALVDGGVSNDQGIAACNWTPVAALDNPCRVRATLVNPDDPANPAADLAPPVYFYANLVSADQVAYAPACQPEDASPLTVHHLLLGPDDTRLGSDDYYSVKEVLDALLCELKAGHIPYDAAPNGNRWDDVNESPTRPLTVQQAIDDLLNNLDSDDIRYSLPNCAPDTNTVLQHLQGQLQHRAGDPAGSYRLRALWNALLCRFDAGMLPYDPTAQQACWKSIDDGNGANRPNTVQQAIDQLACSGNDTSCQRISIKPDDDVHARLAGVTAGQDVEIHFSAGDHHLKDRVVLQGLGHVAIIGCGPHSRVLAPQSESAIQVVACASLRVRDIAMLSSKAGTGDSLDNLNGTLDVVDVAEVDVDHASLSCAQSADKRSAACLRVLHSKVGGGQRSSTRIQRCRINPGRNQIGILLVNADRALVEDNEIQVRKKSKGWRLTTQLEQKKYRQALRRVLISNLSFEGEGLSGSQESAVSGIRRNGAIDFKDEGVRLYFSTDADLVESWVRYLVLNPPAKGVGAYGIFRHVRQLADQILLKQGEVDGFSEFRRWYDVVTSSLPAIARQGIVVAGRQAKEIRVFGNTITGVGQGIHIGLSDNDKENPAIYKGGRVQIRDNVIRNYLSAEYAGERHGILVGNCDSLDVESNRISITHFPTDKPRSADGIRVYGYQGRALLIRFNHMSDFRRGILVRAILDDPNGDGSARPPLWHVINNLLERCDTRVQVDPGSMFLVENNA